MSSWEQKNREMEGVEIEPTIEGKEFLFELKREQYELPTDIDIETVVYDGRAKGEEKETRSDKTVLVIGGIGEDIEVMKPFLQAMAREGKQVVGISLPGYGGSSDPNEAWRVGEGGKDKTDFRDYANVIHGVMDMLRNGKGVMIDTRPSEHIDMIGHSLGGAIVADFAKRYSGEINKAVLVAPAGYETYTTIPKARISPGAVFDFVRSHFPERISHNAKAFLEGVFEEVPPVISNMWGKNFLETGDTLLNETREDGKTVLPRLIQRFWEVQTVTQRKRSRDSADKSKRGIIGSAQDFLEGDEGSEGVGMLPDDILEAEQAGVDVRVVSFQNDGLITTKSMKRMVRWLLGHRQVVAVTEFPKAGHYGILDKPRDVARVIHQFLSSYD